MNTLNDQNLTGVYTGESHPNIPLKYLTASSIIGDKVHNLQDEHMGAIEDILIDITTGKIEYFVIKFGGFLTINEKNFAIPFNLLKVDPAKKIFLLDQTRETLEKAPGFDVNHWPETNFHAEEAYWSFIG